MKSKLGLICATIVISLCLVACSSAPSLVSVDASYSGQQVEVAVGGSLTVTLDSNPSTGFEWVLVNIGDETVLKNVANTYEAPEDTDMVGVPGEETWTFEALKKGTCSVSMEYSQSWEGGEKGAWTFTLTVVVK